MFFYNFYCAKVLLKNGKELIEEIEINKYDLILMDIQMPIINGYEAFLNIKTWCQDTNRKIPICIAMTAYALEHERESIMNIGFNYYLTKPFKKEEVKTILSYINILDK